MKILLNAYPRSGLTTFAIEVRRAFRIFRTHNLQDMAEFDEWIIDKHEPFIYFGNYGDDVILLGIIRNPIDAISSNTERWLKGFTGNTIEGIRILDKRQNKIDSIENLGPVELDFIKHQIKVYTSYLSCLEKNINNVKCFTYEQTRNETDKCLKNIMIFSGININQIDDNKLTKTMINKEDRHPIYFKVREYLEAETGLIDHYNRVYGRVIEFQLGYPILLKHSQTMV